MKERSAHFQGGSQSGAATEEATLTGEGDPGTSVLGASHDRAGVEDLRKQLRMETLLRKRAERALAQHKRII